MQCIERGDLLQSTRIRFVEFMDMLFSAANRLRTNLLSVREKCKELTGELVEAKYQIATLTDQVRKMAVEQEVYVQEKQKMVDSVSSM